MREHESNEERRHEDTEENIRNITQIYGEQERILEIAEHVVKQQSIMKQLEDLEVEKEKENLVIQLSNLMDQRIEKVLSRSSYLRSNMEKRQYDYYCSLKFAQMIKTYTGSYTHFGARAADFVSAIFQTILMFAVRSMLIVKLLTGYFGKYTGRRTILFCLIITNFFTNIYLQRPWLDLTFYGKVIRMFQQTIRRTDLLISPYLSELLWRPFDAVQTLISTSAETLVWVWRNRLKMIPGRSIVMEIGETLLNMAHWIRDSQMFRWLVALWSMMDYGLCPMCSTWDINALKSVLCIYNSHNFHERNCSSLVGALCGEAFSMWAWLRRGGVEFGQMVLPWNWWKTFDSAENGITMFKRDVLDAYAKDY